MSFIASLSLEAPPAFDTHEAKKRHPLGVMPRVFGTTFYFKIGEFIVVALFVLMMDMLITAEFSAYFSFHHLAVFVDRGLRAIIVIDGASDIPVFSIPW